MVGAHGLRVELHPVDRQLPDGSSAMISLPAAGRSTRPSPRAGGQARGRNHQRVVAHHLERRGEALEQRVVRCAPPSWSCRASAGRPARPRRRTPRRSPGGPRQTPEQRHAGRGRGADQRHADAGLASGCTGPGEIRMAAGWSARASSTLSGVVPVDDRLGAELAGILDEVVGEAVVVVEDEEHDPQAIARAASPPCEPARRVHGIRPPLSLGPQRIAEPRLDARGLLAPCPAALPGNRVRHLLGVRRAIDSARSASDVGVGRRRRRRPSRPSACVSASGLRHQQRNGDVARLQGHGAERRPAPSRSWRRRRTSCRPAD